VQGLQPSIGLHSLAGEALGQLEAGGEYCATQVALSPDGQLLATASEEPSPGLALWAWRTVGSRSPAHPLPPASGASLGRRPQRRTAVGWRT
jgi:hypothetical protein